MKKPEGREAILAKSMIFIVSDGGNASDKKGLLKSKAVLSLNVMCLLNTPSERRKNEKFTYNSSVDH